MTSETSAQVLVLGAGVAGLTTASYLEQQGIKTIVIEARDRIGGRIHTVSLGGAQVDLGASWVNGSVGNPLYEFARKHKLKLRVSDAKNIAPFDHMGRPITAEHLLRIRRRPDKIIEEVNKMAEHLRKDISRGEGVKRVLAHVHLTDEEMRVLNWLLANEEADTGVDTMQESLAGWTLDKPYQGEDYHFSGGYSQVTSLLAKGLDIRLGRRAHAVTHNGRVVRIETNKETLTGDFAVITLPHAVLKAKLVRFSPELPEQKQKAIENLGDGLLTKVCMLFPERFWPAHAAFLEHIGDTKGYFSEFLNLYPITGKPVLVGFIAGDLARSMDEEELGDKAAAVLHKRFGRKFIEPSKVIRTHWLHDEFSLGSYSALLPGTPLNSFDALGAPCGKLFFAGEACDSGQYGSVPSAYRSALKAARDIAALVKGK
jgi:monoamine oxidase